MQRAGGGGLAAGVCQRHGVGAHLAAREPQPGRLAARLGLLLLVPLPAGGPGVCAGQQLYGGGATTTTTAAGRVQQQLLDGGPTQREALHLSGLQ